MHKTLAMTLLLGLSAGASTASAHHSAAEFDLSIRDHYISGIVKEFRVRNPHTRIVLEITDEKGTRDVEFEGHSRNNFYRAGWREDMVKVGDRITLNAAPMRDGSDGGYVLGVRTEDGDEF
jgi:hypothetical protein